MAPGSGRSFHNDDGLEPPTTTQSRQEAVYTVGNDDAGPNERWGETEILITDNVAAGPWGPATRLTDDGTWAAGLALSDTELAKWKTSAHEQHNPPIKAAKGRRGAKTGGGQLATDNNAADMGAGTKVTKRKAVPDDDDDDDDDDYEAPAKSPKRRKTVNKLA